VSIVAHYWIGATLVWWVVPVMALAMLISALIASAYAKARTLNEADRMRRSQIGWPVAEVLRGLIAVPALYLAGGVL
jgi:hypothetical protein